METLEELRKQKCEIQKQLDAVKEKIAKLTQTENEKKAFKVVCGGKPRYTNTIDGVMQIAKLWLDTEIYYNNNLIYSYKRTKPILEENTDLIRKEIRKAYKEIIHPTNITKREPK